jgi:hypothetical protein
VRKHPGKDMVTEKGGGLEWQILLPIVIMSHHIVPASAGRGSNTSGSAQSSWHS